MTLLVLGVILGKRSRQWKGGYEMLQHGLDDYNDSLATSANFMGGQEPDIQANGRGQEQEVFRDHYWLSFALF